MAYTARQLITGSLYLSSITARELETPSGDQITVGLDLLNELLSLQSGALVLIPYFTRINISLLQNTERYFLENVFSMEVLTFNLQGVRRPIESVDRQTYFGSARANDIQSIPYIFHLERANGGSYIYVWFKPNQDYAAEASVKKALTNVTLDTDMLLTYDKFYIAYLRWALAEFICLDYDIDFAQQKKIKLAQIKQSLQFVSPPDLNQKKMSMTGNYSEFNYAQANIGGGYTAP